MLIRDFSVTAAEGGKTFDSEIALLLVDKPPTKSSGTVRTPFLTECDLPETYLLSFLWRVSFKQNRKKQRQ